MDWTNETVIRFLELYQKQPCIWDPKHPSHKNKIKVLNAWVYIKYKLGVPCTIKELKKKKESLMSAYRGYRSKIKKSETSGVEVYRPSWFAYSLLDSFIGTVYKGGYNIESNEYRDDDDACETYVVVKPEDNSSELSIKYGPSSPDTPSNYTVTKTSKRQHPSELQQAVNQIEQGLNVIKNVTQQQQSDDDDDECSTFGKLVAKKMRKLNEDCRDLMMIKINQLFYDARHE